MNDYEPSPSESVRDQVALYEATDGLEGGTLEGEPVVMRIVRDGVYVAVAESFWPHFPAYRARAGREIPMLLLEPLTERTNS